MSGFSDVDRSESVEGLAAYLRMTDSGLAAMKAYMALAARQSTPNGLVVDLGCGLGHDVSRLQSAGLDAIGVDSSKEMLRRAREGAPNSPLVCADAAALPFRDRSVDGCRVERVLQHVAEPSRVVVEIARVVRPGGGAWVFEPDYGTFRVESAVVADGSFPAALMRVRHPRVGAQLARLLEDVGFRIDDVVTESSRGYGFEHLPIPTTTVISRAIEDGKCDAATAKRWLAEQRERSSAGEFRAVWEKVLVVGTRQPAS